MTPSREYANALGPVHEDARAMAGRMDLDKNSEYITDHLMRIVFPERDADDAFRELLRRNAYDNLDIMWRIINGRDEIETKPPFGALAFSDTAVELNVSLSQFERIYRVGAGLVSSLWHQHVELTRLRGHFDLGLWPGRGVPDGASSKVPAGVS